MSEFLRSLGITGSGVDGRALYIVMAALACWIAHSSIRNRSPNAPKAIVFLTYTGAALLAVVAFWQSSRLASENMRLLAGAAYIAALVFATRYIGRAYLGVGDQKPDDKKPAAS